MSREGKVDVPSNVGSGSTLFGTSLHFRVEKAIKRHISFAGFGLTRDREIKKATRLYLNPMGKMTSPVITLAPANAKLLIMMLSPRRIHCGSSASSVDECRRASNSQPSCQAMQRRRQLLPLIATQFMLFLLYRRG